MGFTPKGSVRAVGFDSYVLRPLRQAITPLIASFNRWRIQVDKSTPAAFAAF
jgi:hypothetical protein